MSARRERHTALETQGAFDENQKKATTAAPLSAFQFYAGGRVLRARR